MPVSSDSGSSSRSVSAPARTAVGLAVMVSATMFWSTGSFLSRRLALPRDPFVATSYEMAFGGAFLAIASVALGEWGELSGTTFALDSVLAWVYLVVMGLLIGFHGVRLAPARCANLTRRDAPVREPARRDRARNVLFLGERLSPWSLAGAALVLGAVYVTVRREGRAPFEKRRSAVPSGPPQVDSGVAGVLDRA